jgi:hypothetical protein
MALALMFSDSTINYASGLTFYDVLLRLSESALTNAFAAP